MQGLLAIHQYSEERIERNKMQQKIIYSHTTESCVHDHLLAKGAEMSKTEQKIKNKEQKTMVQ